MAKITIDKERCKGCLLCISFCPKGLIKKSNKWNKRGSGFVEFQDNGECLACLKCALICPDCCIEVYK
ncbi:MAG TPA: 4Fe-4S dicluster domain-containing protein [Candidatus Margulisiibacteriota bacterium]|nr:4Fe-4S dicluster domain-containing protein [Candidatus Margulisiibacteriota bacterium]